MDNLVMKMRAHGVDFFYGKNHALKNINLNVAVNKVTAIIGPSGCGKSTFIRLLNRMNEMVPNTTLTGKIYLDCLDILSPCIDPADVRRRVGMVFQKPNPFPKNIFENISYGLEVNGIKNKQLIEERVVTSLKRSAIWEEVKDRLHDSALRLSGGQQQQIGRAHV